MKLLSLFVLGISLLFGTVCVQAQQQTADTAIHYVVDRNPTFPNGHEAMMKFIGTHIHFPKEAKDSGITGKVYASFVVEPDGSLSHIKILKGLGHGCDKELIRVLKLMPKWDPGLLKGKPVRSYTTQMVSFRIENPASQQQNALENKIYTKVDSLPVFAVGGQGIEHFLISKLWYPKRTVKRNVTDTVYVSFVVEKDNSITHIHLMPPKSHKNIYDYEALRVVSLLPVSHPAVLHHKIVRARLYVPVVFDHKNVKLKEGKYHTLEYNAQKYIYFIPKGHMAPPPLLIKQVTPVKYTKKPDSTTVFAIVQKMPEFPGGMMALMQYLSHHIHYPAEALKKGCSGKVFAHFIIERDGSISHIKILSGICPSLDEEAVKVIKNMPKWTPGYQKGKPVRVGFNLPIKFTSG